MPTGSQIVVLGGSGRQRQKAARDVLMVAARDVAIQKTLGAKFSPSVFYSVKKLRRVLEIVCGAFQRCSHVRL